MNLGALQRPKDPRDILLGTVQAPITILPTTFLPDISWLEPLYQGHTPYCGAHAGTHFKMKQEYADNYSVQQLSPRSLWIPIKQIDGVPLEDGTNMRSIFQTLKSKGVASLKLLNNDVSLPITQYSDPSVMTQEIIDDAQIRIGDAYAFIDNPTVDEIKSAIIKNGEVLALIHCDDGFFGTTTPTFTTKKYGHFVVFDGYAENAFRIIDSTEVDLSKEIKYIDFKYIDFVIESGTQVDVPDWKVKLLTSEYALLRLVATLYQKLILLKK